MNIRGNVIWITRTAAMTALLVAVQFVTGLLGNQIVTGSAVNLLLVVTILTCGLASGATVAVISPMCAYLVGVGPMFPLLIPFIALGNVALVIVWFVLGSLNKAGKFGKLHVAASWLTVAAAAVVKFLVLYSGVVLLAVPYLLKLNETQNTKLISMFSYPQLVTATIGGAVALAAVTPIKKAIKSRV